MELEVRTLGRHGTHRGVVECDEYRSGLEYSGVSGQEGRRTDQGLTVVGDLRRVRLLSLQEKVTKKKLRVC